MHKKHHDTLVVAVTFFIGMVAGSYLYLVGFAPNFEEIEMPIDGEVTSASLVIFGEMYGGDRYGAPPRFELSANGGYRYTPFNEEPSIPVAAEEGMLPEALMLEVRQVLAPRTLKAAAEEVTPESCAMFVDGSEYRYRIGLADETYVLDTCGTNFAYDSELAKILEKVWVYLDNPVPASGE